MVRKICHAGFPGLFAVGIAVAALATGCDQGNPAGEVVLKRSAVTAAAPSQPGIFRESDVVLPPGGAVIQGIPMPAMRLPGQPKGKTVAKPVLAATVGTPAPAPPAAYVAKQNEYLRQWNALQPTIATLSVAEQDARRAALKRQVVGE